MRQEIIDLYDEFTHRGLDRRVFMSRLAELAGGTAAAASALAVLRADPAAGALVATDDPRVTAEAASIGERLQGYLVKPADASGKLPGVVVVHENRGLNPHTEDVARRFAVDGFLALAVDFLAPKGGTPADEDQARALVQGLEMGEVVNDAKAAIAWLRARPESNGKVGIVGYCWGGGVVGQVAAAEPALDAGVVYYGSPPATESVAAIQAPLLLHYAGQDERINARVPAFEEALRASGKSFDKHVYEGAQHAFNNDTSQARYNEQAAGLAWERTVAFFRETLAAS